MREDDDPRDYEAIMQAREDKRAELWLERQDGVYGRIEEWRPSGLDEFHPETTHNPEPTP